MKNKTKKEPKLYEGSYVLGYDCDKDIRSCFKTDCSKCPYAHPITKPKISKKWIVWAKQWEKDNFDTSEEIRNAYLALWK